MKLLKASKIGILISSVLVCIAFIIPSITLLAIGECVFFSCFILYVFKRNSEYSNDPYEDYLKGK